MMPRSRAGGLASATLFDPLQEIEKSGGGDLGIGRLESGAAGSSKSHLFFCQDRGCRAIGFEVRDEFGDDESERIARGGLGGDPLEFLTHRRIDAFAHRLFRFVAFRARFSEGHRGVGPNESARSVPRWRYFRRDSLLPFG